MSDPNEPPRPEGQSEGTGAGSGDVPPPPGGGTPPPPPPPPQAPPPPPPPYGDSPYGAAGGGGYGDGGYGAPPPPPPPGAPYGQPDPNAYSPTDAIGYGWKKFVASPSTLLVPMIVVWLVLIVITAIVELLIRATLLSTHDCTKTVLGTQVQTQCGPGFATNLLGSALISALIVVVFNVAAAGLYKGAANIADGRPFGLGMLFEGWDKAQVAIAALIIAVATFIGTLLCYIPGLIVGFLTMFTMLFIVDKQLGAVDAIKASFRLVVDNLGSTILFYLLAAVVILVGACVCLVGLLVAAPVVLIALAYTYRRLQGEPVVPA